MLPEHPTTAIPVDLDDLTPAWFTEVLGRRDAAVAVDAAEVVDAHAGTSGRARVRLSYAASNSDLPEIVFVKFQPWEPEQREFLRFTGIGVMEARFYRTLGDDLPVLLPRAWHADWSGEGAFVMILEDLQSSGCRFPRRDEADTEERAFSTVEELARLHAALWESPRFDDDLAWVPDQAGFGRMDRATAAQASGAYVRQAFERFVDEMPAGFRTVGDLYASRTAEILDLFDAGPRTLIHGDCHVGNLFVGGRRTGFYDWALLSRAPGVRDVAYTCCYSMSRGARRALESELLDRYLEVLGTRGIELDRETAWRQYRLFAVFAWVSATTTAAMGTKWQPEELARGAMERATDAVIDLDSVGLIEESLGN